MYSHLSTCVRIFVRFFLRLSSFCWLFISHLLSGFEFSGGSGDPGEGGGAGALLGRLGPHPSNLRVGAAVHRRPLPHHTGVCLPGEWRGCVRWEI